MALARVEVGDGGQGRRRRRASGYGPGRSVPRCTTRVARAPCCAASAAVPALLASTSRARANVLARPPARRRRGWRRVEDVAAVDGDDERHVAAARAPDRVAGGHRVVGVDEVEGELARAGGAARCPAGAPPRRPSSHRCARAAAREAHVVDRDPVEHRSRGAGPARRAAARGVAALDARHRRHGPVQHQHSDLGAGVACRERLPVRPHAEHRVGGAGVELGDDGDLHAPGSEARSR